MRIDCKHVWQHISAYIDGDVDASLRAEIDKHLETCEICSAVLDSTRNVVVLMADGRVFELPAGFSRRLQRRLAQQSSSWLFDSARTFWILAVAAVAVIVGGVSLSNSSVFRQPDMRSLLAQSPHGIPSSLMVVVSSEGRLFHVPGCKYLHRHDGESPQMMTAAEAIKEGYAPCPRCLRQYLSSRVECPRVRPGPEFSVTLPPVLTTDSGI